MVSDEAVEAAVDAVLDHWRQFSSGRCACGEFISRDPQEVARHLAKAALAAAAPFIASQAWEEGRDTSGPYPVNPYRSEQ